MTYKSDLEKEVSDKHNCSSSSSGSGSCSGSRSRIFSLNQFIYNFSNKIRPLKMATNSMVMYLILLIIKNTKQK